MRKKKKVRRWRGRRRRRRRRRRMPVMWDQTVKVLEMFCDVFCDVAEKVLKRSE